jgi:hypothetical protein
MINTMTSQNIDHSSWDILYIYVYITDSARFCYVHEAWLVILKKE